MSTISTIRILEAEPNKKGDLFGRLMGDLFLALGYDQVRLNIHKSGREIDVDGQHRTERRRVVAECKAMESKIGGDDINKFVGALSVEKHKYPNTTGYFISLSGFKETAIEQEKEVGDERVICLNGNRIIEELIKGKIIKSQVQAMERAGRCAAGQTLDLLPEAECELLAHEIGWIWLVYFMKNKQRTHFALIHADGESIASSIAQTIIQSDKSIGGSLHILKYLPPPAELSISESQLLQAKTKYLDYLKSECGEITLEGLPADSEVGSRRLNLENMFVPLYLEQSSESNQNPSSSSEDDNPKDDEKVRQPFGKVLTEYSRLAILATPGGGKTTLLKRIAVAYAFPERRKLIDDNLPDRSWLPLFIRCRQLGESVKSPIRDILHAIYKRTEMGEELAEAFKHLVNQTLRGGDALLLVDGLDEISDEGDRVSFVNQMRTFLATYPTINIIVTSREAGFRIVGGALSAHCKHYRLADFDDNDIIRLTLAWHKEVVGDRSDVRIEAEKLAKTIINSDRVRLLAKNPLLLTTLMLVKRWVGQLPTRRSILYGKAIEVLLMTWNVEGYEPIDQDEAIPQLAFVAFTMMNDGVQRISSKRLNEILISARKQMPEVLSYAKLSGPEFIQRIELRSSLIIMSGHEIEQGTLYPMYEFRHLTFQEYLTAKAIVDGYYPDRKDDDTLLTILKSHLEDAKWKEVVPLAAVLAGRKVQPLIRLLIDRCKKSPQLESAFPALLLGKCILDEIQVEPDLIKESLEWIARRTVGPSEIIKLLFRGRYGKMLQNVVQDAYISSSTDLTSLGSALADITFDQLNLQDFQDTTPQLVEKITSLLASENQIQKAEGALAIMEFAFNSRKSAKRNKCIKILGDKLVPILYSDEAFLHVAACWAFVWLGKNNLWSPEYKPDVIPRLLEIWRESNLPDAQDKVSWAISELPIIDRELVQLPEPTHDLIDFIKQKFSLEFKDKNRNDAKVLASLVIAFYLKKPWTDEELSQILISKYDLKSPRGKFISTQKLKELLNALGEPGRVQLEVIKQKKIISPPKPRVKSKKTRAKTSE